MAKIVYYQLRYWLPVYLYAFAIFLSSHQSRLEMPIKIIGIDKMLHFIAYGVLAGLIYRACRSSAVDFIQPTIVGSKPVGQLPHYKSWKIYIFQKAYFISVICSVLYGFSDEFHQFYIPGRQTSEWDFVADALGAIIAMVLILKFTPDRR